MLRFMGCRVRIKEVGPRSGDAEAATRQRRPVGQRLQLGPHELWMDAPTEATIGAAHHVLLPDPIHEAAQALSHKFRVFQHVGRV